MCVRKEHREYMYAVYIWMMIHESNLYYLLQDAPVDTPEHAAGVKIAPPRFLVREECRERWGHYVCDGRRSISEIAAE